MRLSVSLRLDSKIVDKADMIAIKEDRSLNYIVNRMIKKMISDFETQYGSIDVDNTALKNFRNRKGRSSSAKS